MALAFALLGAISPSDNGHALAAAYPVAPFCTPPAASGPSRDLAAASTIVAIGIADVPVAGLRAAARDERSDYLEIPVRVTELLKGQTGGTVLHLRFYPHDRPYAPTVRQLIEASGRPAIYHLVAVDEGPAGLYFAGNSPAALQTADPGNVRAIRLEVARQAAVLRAWRPDPHWPRFQEVRRLIAELAAIRPGSDLARRAQASVFLRLEQLGVPAVPAIVAHMDDRRRLAFSEISLANQAPDAFEATAFYGPEEVVDALAAILGQITGANFGAIHNGGSERERRDAVNGWRVYAAAQVCQRR